MAVNISDERFAAVAPGGVVAWWVIENSHDGVNMYSESDLANKHLIWSMCKGFWGDDWCIYVTPSEWILSPISKVLQKCHDYGDKPLSHSVISRMVSVSERLYDKYRR